MKRAHGVSSLHTSLTALWRTSTSYVVKGLMLIIRLIFLVYVRWIRTGHWEGHCYIFLSLTFVPICLGLTLRVVNVSELKCWPMMGSDPIQLWSTLQALCLVSETIVVGAKKGNCPIIFICQLTLSYMCWVEYEWLEVHFISVILKT